MFAGGLAAGFAGPAAATECPAGAPVPFGLIGNTWRTVDRYQAGGVVKDRIGCPIEPEHGVPGLNGRLQTFQNGQIAWTPDQGPSMTIWAIRDKAHFRVQWSTNDSWTYDSYLIRWDRDGQNIGQRDISGTYNGWWDFDFDTPGRYTFIVEGRMRRAATAPLAVDDSRWRHHPAQRYPAAQRTRQRATATSPLPTHN